jgi:hypothetical protein
MAANMNSALATVLYFWRNVDNLGLWSSCRIQLLWPQT